MERALILDFERRFPGGAAVRARATVPVAGGTVTVLFGPSGAGKTTVLRCVAGLDRPQAGALSFAGEVWSDAAAGVFVPPERRGVGMVFQDHALFPHLSVAENVAYGLFRLDRAERERRVRDAAGRTGIEDLLARRPGSLSAGQRQRVALARALAPAPRLLLLDEPLSALDAPARGALRGALRRTLDAAGVPALVVTHDRVEALALGERVVVIAGGSVRQVGGVEEVFAAPVDAEVARVVGTENVLPARLVRSEGGLALVRAGEADLVGLDPGGLGAEAWACIRAEEIVLEDAPHVSSARNVMEGAVADRADEGPLIRIGIACDAGFRLVALVTRESAARMALTPGRRVAALVKAPSVRLVPRGA